MCLIIFKVPVKGISLANGETVLSVTAKCSSNAPTKLTGCSFFTGLLSEFWQASLDLANWHNQCPRQKITNVCCYLFLFLFSLFPFPSQIPLAIIWLSPISWHWNAACWLVYSGWDDWGKDWGPGPKCHYWVGLIALSYSRNRWFFLMQQSHWD